MVWEASGYMCSDRLQPFVPTVVPHFERHRQLELCRHTRELLLGASVATLGRNLSSLIVINESHLRTLPNSWITTIVTDRIAAFVYRVPSPQLRNPLVEWSRYVSTRTVMMTLSQYGPSAYSGWEDTGPPLHSYVGPRARPGGGRTARLGLRAGDSRAGRAALADGHGFTNTHRFGNYHRKAKTKPDREVVAQSVAQLDSAPAGRHATRR